MTSRAKRNLITFTKWGCYFLVLVLGAALQTTPGFLAVGQVRPIFILPVCLAVAVFEGEYAGAAFGVVGGLMWDLTAGRVPGLMALQLLVVCFVAALLVEIYLRVNSMNFVLVTGCCCLVVTGLDFLFYTLMPGHAGALHRYFGVYLPMTVFTAALSPLPMLLVRRIYRKFVFIA